MIRHRRRPPGIEDLAERLGFSPALAAKYVRQIEESGGRDAVAGWVRRVIAEWQADGGQLRREERG
jgi:hypothetical protein